MKSFWAEHNVVQFVAFAAPVPAPVPIAASGARAGSTSGGESIAADRARKSPWQGSRPTRVLLAPDLDAADDCWAEVLPRLAAQVKGDPNVTLGLVLPAKLHREHPEPVKALPDDMEVDLLLIEPPASPAGWEAVVRESTIVVLSTPGEELAALAARARVPTHDATRDAQLRATPVR